MSLLKGKHEDRVILDFSKGKISKNSIINSLRKAEVLDIYKELDNIGFVNNLITIGMYTIHLHIGDGEPSFNKTHLKEYGSFHASIYEKCIEDNKVKNINLLSDHRFKYQYWAKLNSNSRLRIKNLVDLIMYTRRLNDLKSFL